MYSIFGFLNKQKKEKISSQEETLLNIPIISNREESKNKDIRENASLEKLQTDSNTKKERKKTVREKKSTSNPINKKIKTGSEKKSKRNLKKKMSENKGKKGKMDADRFVLEIQKIDEKLHFLKIYHDKVFNQIVSLIKERKEDLAKIKSLELAIIRKKLHQLEKSKKSLEQISIRLSLIYDVNETLEVLDPLLRNTIATPVEKSTDNKKNRKKNVTKYGAQNYDWKPHLATMINDTLHNSGISFNVESVEDVKDIFSKVFVK